MPRARKPIDMVAVAEARTRLAELAVEFPAAFAEDRLPTTEAKLRRVLATNPDPKTPLVIRIHASTRAKLEERAKATGTKASTLARKMIEAGLVALLFVLLPGCMSVPNFGGSDNIGCGRGDICEAIAQRDTEAREAVREAQERRLLRLIERKLDDD